MKRDPSVWKPVYTVTPKTARLLMDIERARAETENRPLPPPVEAELRRQARVRSTHYSTRIEGNRLTLAEAEKVIGGTKTSFHGRERDVREVRNYWNALLRVLLQQWVADGWLVVAEPSRRKRAYALSAVYRQYLATLSAMPGSAEG
jgi:Fic family protein